MKTLNRLVLLGIVFASFSIAGTESGGGGGVVLRNGQPILLDYFHLLTSTDSHSFFDSPTPEAKASLPEGEFRANHNVLSSNPAFKLAVDTVNKWQSLPMDRISHIVIGALSGPLMWNFSNAEISAPEFFRPPFLKDSEKVLVAAYYSMKDGRYSVAVSLPLWEKMNLSSQAGLIIHESLRQVQFGFGDNFSEEALQQATVIYMMCEPNTRLNHYLSFILRNSPELARSIYGNFSTILEKSCVRIQ